MELLRKDAKIHMNLEQCKGIDYLTFPILKQSGLVNHLFTTRTGGVSEGIYSTMNLSYNRGDKKEAVDENFRRIAELFQSTPDSIVCSQQTHTTNIKRVTKEDCGKGVVRALDYSDIDGLITNVPEIILCTSYADCVPLYFVDQKKRAIGLGHSGWRGTVARMGEKMLMEMNKAFGTEPDDVLVAIGPSICQSCYEIGEDVASIIREKFQWRWQSLLEEGTIEGKFHFNLWEANKMILLGAGVLEENLEVTDICTCCNSDYIFSHRATMGKRGNAGAFLELRKS